MRLFFRPVDKKYLGVGELPNGTFDDTSTWKPITKYLEDVVTNNKKISIQISNDGAESMYSGTIKNVIHKFGWLNIMDPTFNLHVKDMQINKIWLQNSLKPLISKNYTIIIKFLI